MAREMRWWGWGEDARTAGPPDFVLEWFGAELGALEARRGPVALEEVRLAD